MFEISCGGLGEIPVVRESEHFFSLDESKPATSSIIHFFSIVLIMATQSSTHVVDSRPAMSLPQTAKNFLLARPQVSARPGVEKKLRIRCGGGGHGSKRITLQSRPVSCKIRLAQVR